MTRQNISYILRKYPAVKAEYETRIAPVKEQVKAKLKELEADLVTTRFEKEKIFQEKKKKLLNIMYTKEAEILHEITPIRQRAAKRKLLD
jgi:ppGpp synthetase/RelA/SpoT-type nucleotidyltranferase